MKQSTYILLGLGLVGAYVLLNRKKQTGTTASNVLANTPWANVPQTTGTFFIPETWQQPDWSGIWQNNPPVTSPTWQQDLVNQTNAVYNNNPPAPINLNIPVF